MEQKSNRIRISLTDTQRKQIKEEAGADVETLEFTTEELEQRIAPLKIKFSDVL